MGIHPAIQEYAAAYAIMFQWEQSGTRIPSEVKARLCKATQAVLALQDQLDEDLPQNKIGVI